MDLPVSVNTLGGLITLGLGVLGLFWPMKVAGMVSIQPDGLRGLSEIRATYGGVFFAIGLFAVMWQDPNVFRALGFGWFGAAAGRMFSIVRDESGSGANYGAVAMEALVGLLLVVPWERFFGA
ncbi:MAG: DUF4345 family protein [Deltaproteobacteria bacterium]|nr:DUF4345 family protein [Deltaproteobacteria bacterium]